MTWKKNTLTCCMYGIFAIPTFWLTFMGNVGKSRIHGSIWDTLALFFQKSFFRNGGEKIYLFEMKVLIQVGHVHVKQKNSVHKGKRSHLSLQLLLFDCTV